MGNDTMMGWFLGLPQDSQTALVIAAMLSAAMVFIVIAKGD